MDVLSALSVNLTGVPLLEPPTDAPVHYGYGFPGPSSGRAADPAAVACAGKFASELSASERALLGSGGVSTVESLAAAGRGPGASMREAMARGMPPSELLGREGSSGRLGEDSVRSPPLLRAASDELFGGGAVDDGEASVFAGSPAGAMGDEAARMHRQLSEMLRGRGGPGKCSWPGYYLPVQCVWNVRVTFSCAFLFRRR